MKDKEKQIEEMAKVMNGYICKDRPCKECNYYGDTKILEPYCDYYLKARELVKQGYQKIDKDSVVLTREKYEDMKRKRKYILGNRVYSDATLKSWAKEDLIEHIRILEHNWASAEESLNIQAKNFKMLLEQIRKETAEKIINDILEFLKVCPNILTSSYTIYYEKVPLKEYLTKLAKQFGVEI